MFSKNFWCENIKLCTRTKESEMTSYISVEILTLFALSISLLNAANKNLIFFVARKIASPVVTNQKE